MAAPLPPFGIRNLRQSQEPYSVLQVNEAQYRSTIETDPTAALTYVDEDDGENVVVGSSLELKQRLEEPASTTAPQVQYYNSTNAKPENQYIHLFDIQNTRSSQSIWSQHHASYVNHQDLLAKRTGTSRRSSVAESTAPLLDRPEAREGAVRIEDRPQSYSQASGSPQLSVILSEAVPDLVDNLANLLQTTSDTLRKAAEKTREANRSPIEDVLSGVSGIVTEIGNFGLSLLETMEKKDEENELTEKCQPPSQQSDQSSTLSRLSFADAKDAISVSTPSINNDPAAHVIATPDVASPHVESPHPKEDGCHFCKTFKLQCRKSPNSTMACTNCVTLARPCTNMPTPVNPFLDPSERENDLEEASIKAPRHSSILDQDTDDADFSRRYPPLLSLRRANTVAGLREHAATLIKPDPEFHSLSRHNSWALRFPHRPVPQVLDAETQRRKDFARRCFPGQEYTPGVGTDEFKVPRPHHSKLTRPCKPLAQADRHKLSEMPQMLVPEPVKNEDEPESDPPTPQVTDTLTHEFSGDEQARPNKIVPSALEHKQQSSTFPLAESSTSFWGRMTPNDVAQDQDRVSKPHPTEHLTRHKSLANRQSERNPFQNLNRSRTVNDGPKTSSRLSHPFDPLCFPNPVISDASGLKTASNPRAAEHQASSASSERDVTDAARLGSQRPTSLRRPFSPVWEDHSDLNEKQDKTDRNHSLDQRGESSSLYSPPARHMKSVPNFSTLRTNTSSANSNLLRPLSLHSATRTIPAAIISSRSDVAPPPPPPPPPSSRTRGGFEEPQEVPVHPVLQTGLPPFPAPPPPRPNQTNIHDSETWTPTDRFVKACLDKLLLMGYGSDDANLRSRLHIYAEAAKGDVMDAVEMIEEDKQANAETQPRNSQQYDGGMDWESC